MYLEITRGTVCDSEQVEPGDIVQTGSSLLLKLGKAKESTKEAYDAFQKKSKKAKKAPQNRKVDEGELEQR